MGGMVEEADFLYLTTTGRRSGVAREIEIWFTRVHARYYVIAQPGERAHWGRNIQAEPRVRVRVGGAGRRGRGPGGGRDDRARPPCRGGGPIAPEVPLGRGLIVELAPPVG